MLRVGGGTQVSCMARAGGRPDGGGLSKFRSRTAVFRGAQATALWLMPLAFWAFPAGAQATGSVYTGNSSANDVSQFAILSGGLLSPLSPASIGAGTGAWAVAVTPDGKSAYVTNSGESTVSQYDIDPGTGLLSAKTPATVATGAGPGHDGLAVSPDGKSAYVTNLNENTVSQYDINPITGALSPKAPATVATGSEPLDVAVTPTGKSAYVANYKEETVSQYDINPTTGALSPKAPATVAAGSGSAGVAVTPDGKSAYVKNAGTVSQYDIDPITGALSPKTPASVASGTASGTGDTTPIVVSPDGRSAYVTNESGVEPSVLQYDIDPGTGRLSPKTPASVATSTQPSNIALTPDGKSAYVTLTFGEEILQYDIDPLTGALSPKTPAAVAGTHPIGIAVGPLPLVHATTTGVSCAPASVVAGAATACTATVTDTAASPTAPTGTVAFTSNGPGTFGAANCTLVPVSSSTASCQLAYTPSATSSSPVRSDTTTAAYSGDSLHTESSGSSSVQVLSIGLLGHGSFVIGDKNATVGAKVLFWGASWPFFNSLSGGSAFFPGFAAHTPNNPPQCGDSWTSGLDDSFEPPKAVPSLMAVVVSSSIKFSNWAFHGNTVKVVVVKTDPGYRPSLFHAGSGTVVAQVCP